MTSAAKIFRAMSHRVARARHRCSVDDCGERRPHYHREDPDWGEHLVFTGRQPWEVRPWQRRLWRLWLVPLAVHEDEARAARSRLVWGYRPEHGVYVLTPIGLVNTVRDWLGLHRWEVRS